MRHIRWQFVQCANFQQWKCLNFVLLSDFQYSSETINETKGTCNNKNYIKQGYKNIAELCELKVLTVVATKGAIFENAVLLSLIEIHGCFEGRCFLELQSRSLCAWKTGIDTGKRGHSFVAKPVGPREDRAKIPVTLTRCFLPSNVPIWDSGSKRRQVQNCCTKTAMSSVSTGDSGSKGRQAQNCCH
jgi:hypothetical protein